MKKVKLPNGEDTYCLQKATALSLYHEIFVNDEYSKSGLAVKDGDVIFDVGANIGMFTRYIASKAKDLQIFTFEPVPAIFEVQQANLGLITSTDRIKPYNIGLGAKEETVTINYYPNVPAQSAIVPVDFEERERYFLDHFETTVGEKLPNLRHVPKFLRKPLLKLSDKLIYKAKKVPVQVRPLSAIIKENAIDRIDLLKLDAENYDLPILSGIDEEAWGKIRQVFMEVHCSITAVDEHLDEVKEILEGKGFVVTTDKESEFAWIGSPMVYARRK